MRLFGAFKKKSKSVGTAKSYEEIRKIEDKNRFIVTLYSYISKKCNYGMNMDALTASERVFYIVQALETEVNNGGFEQFFWNSDGEFANDAEQSLMKIGAENTSFIVRKALVALDEVLPTNQSERQNLLSQTDESVQKTLAECDCDFYNDTDYLEELSYRFVLKNENDFL